MALPEFGSKQYWDDEYKDTDDAFYDWVVDFEDVHWLFELLARRGTSATVSRAVCLAGGSLAAGQEAGGLAESKAEMPVTGQPQVEQLDRQDVEMLEFLALPSSSPHHAALALDQTVNRALIPVGCIYDAGTTGETSLDGLSDSRNAYEQLFLHLGSGNSIVPEKLWERGYKRQIVTDISEICVENMQKLSEEKSIPTKELSYQVADACDLTHLDWNAVCTDLPAMKEASVDFVFEKSTLDAMLCDDGNHALKIFRMLAEVHRLLKPGSGIFLMVSMHRPREVEIYLRLPCFKWTFEWVAIPDQHSHRPRHVRPPAEKADAGEASSCQADSAGEHRKRRREILHYGYILRRSQEPMDEETWKDVLSKVESQPDEDPKRAWML
eukprot:TRINITY_DN21943_c0_g1_i1.p1 TRINITY_DN21943_c0_g1~~TRINITY_DN21943_c0_g1_i1.p1  ORF type:complete len:382 (-),score=63.90 TRINITY_DN21943_c0_g1_i1:473-1618(-)